MKKIIDAGEDSTGSTFAVKTPERRRNFFFREQPKTCLADERPDFYFASLLIPNEDLIERSKALVTSYWRKTSRSGRGPDQPYSFLSKMESNSQRPFPFERNIIYLTGCQTKK